MPELFYWEAVRDALAEEMRANAKVLLLAGTDTNSRPYGNWLSVPAPVDPATAALLQEFGAERVRVVPASAAAMAGATAGAALCGYRVVATVRDAASLPVVLSQLTGRAGTEAVPVVLRVQSSSALEAWAVHTPGVLVAAASTPEDAKGLLCTALRTEEDPVVFLEHAQLCSTRGDVPAGDCALPFGVAAVRRAGAQVTVVAYGRLVAEALSACEQVAADGGGDAELLDLRTLKPFDLAAVLESVRKTGRVLLCSDAPATGNFVCELAMRINEHGFDDLDAPVRRLCAPDVPEQGGGDVAWQTRIVEAIRELASDE